MSKESIPVQQDMFSGEWVDARSDYQKRKDRQEQNQSQQLVLFSASELYQFGVQHRPWLNELPRPHLALEILDTRTPEEQESDLMRAAEALTTTLFALPGSAPSQIPPEVPPDESAATEADPDRYDFLLFGRPFRDWLAGESQTGVNLRPSTTKEAPLMVNRGYRARARQQLVPVRRRDLTRQNP